MEGRYRKLLSEEPHVGHPVVDLAQHVLQILTGYPKHIQTFSRKEKFNMVRAHNTRKDLQEQIVLNRAECDFYGQQGNLKPCKQTCSVEALWLHLYCTAWDLARDDNTLTTEQRQGSDRQTSLQISSILCSLFPAAGRVAGVWLRGQFLHCTST